MAGGQSTSLPTRERLNPEPNTLYPKPQTLNPNPQTSNPKPQTPNSKPLTLNPKPQTFRWSRVGRWWGGRGACWVTLPSTPLEFAVPSARCLSLSLSHDKKMLSCHLPRVVYHRVCNVYHGNTLWCGAMSGCGAPSARGLLLNTATPYSVCLCRSIYNTTSQSGPFAGTGLSRFWSASI